MKRPPEDLPFDPPLRVEPSQQDQGRKLVIVDGAGRIVVKTLSNRKRDRAAADYIAARCNEVA